jgi:hypothetical protein
METVTQIWAPVGAFLGPFLPKLLGALVILIGAWLAARLVRLGLLRAASAARLDERSHSAGLSATLAGVAGALVWLLALPALLGTLGLDGLLIPVNALLTRLMGFVPNLFGAAVVLGVGVLVARIASQIVTGLLRAAGSEKAAASMGLGTALGADGLAGMAGKVVFALLLLPTLVAALQPLGLDALTLPLSRMLEAVTGLIPKLISAAIIVGISVLIARTLASVVTATLTGMGLDKLPERMGSAPLEMGGRGLSDMAGTGVMLAVVMVAITQACEILGLPILTDMLGTLGATMTRLAVALVILGVGLLLASTAGRTLQASRLANAKGLAHAARAAILFFAAALALRQAGLPAEIVGIAFGAVVGGLAIGVAVALGLGGQHAAARVLERVASDFDSTPLAKPAAVPASPSAPATAPSPAP